MEKLPHEDPLRIPTVEEAEETAQKEPAEKAAVTEADAALRATLDAAINAGVARVFQAFEEKLALDRFREQQIAKLHAELQGYRTDLVGRTVRPFIQALIRMHDELGKAVETLRKEDPAKFDMARFFKLLESFQDEVVILLDQNGVEAYRETGVTFNPRTQRAVRTVPTEDSAEAGKILEQRRPGFRQGEQILEKERVIVAVYNAKTITTGAASAPTAIPPNQETK